MAKLTLPHPNKDFVPVSPLTAQELDEMVANTKAVADFANGLASGKNIDDGSIEPSKLKPGTLPFFSRPTEVIQLNVGYDLKFSLQKVGKFVMVTGGGVKNVQSPGARGERIPDGWRPAVECHIIVQAINSSQDRGTAIVLLSPDGSIQWHGATGHNEYYTNGFYILS